MKTEASHPIAAIVGRKAEESARPHRYAKRCGRVDENGDENGGRVSERDSCSSLPPDMIYMLLPYKKTDQDDLTPEQLKLLRALVEEWLA